MPRGDQAASELSAAMGDIFTVVIDPVANTITFHADVGGIEKRQKANFIPRWKNCFVIYRLDKNPLVAALNPDCNNNDRSKIIGELWRNETQSVKDEYKRRAQEEKRQHAIAYPDYQYKPRKPSEKKKRMTKNKLAKLAASKRATQASNQVAQQQLPLPVPAYPTLADQVCDVILTLGTNGEEFQVPEYDLATKHHQTRMARFEQTRQERLETMNDMEDFFEFDAADGPISDAFVANGALEGSWGAEK